jgi:hypothetical protein
MRRCRSYLRYSGFRQKSVQSAGCRCGQHRRTTAALPRDALRSDDRIRRGCAVLSGISACSCRRESSGWDIRAMIFPAVGDKPRSLSCSESHARLLGRTYHSLFGRGVDPIILHSRPGGAGQRQNDSSSPAGRTDAHSAPIDRAAQRGSRHRGPILDCPSSKSPANSSEDG